MVAGSKQPAPGSSLLPLGLCICIPTAPFYPRNTLLSPGASCFASQVRLNLTVLGQAAEALRGLRRPPIHSAGSPQGTPAPVGSCVHGLPEPSRRHCSHRFQNRPRAQGLPHGALWSNLRCMGGRSWVSVATSAGRSGCQERVGQGCRPACPRTLRGHELEQ